MRDQIVETMQTYAERTEIPVSALCAMAKLPRGKFYAWQERFGVGNNHNGNIPKATWLLDWEKEAMIAYAKTHEEEGYRRLCYRMMDEDVVSASPSSVYRVLKQEGLLQKFTGKPSKRGTGFVQPLEAHEQWHTDITYVNVLSTFLFLISVLDGYSRSIVHHELRASMEEYDVQLVVQRAREKHPDEHPRLISDRGGQFIAKDFKKFLRYAGLKQTLISSGYPQSNGKLERWHRTIKSECIRKTSFLSIADARNAIAAFIQYYNDERLHSALHYVSPRAMLEGRQRDILKQRDEKLEKARQARIQNFNSNSTLHQESHLSDSR